MLIKKKHSNDKILLDLYDLAFEYVYFYKRSFRLWSATILNIIIFEAEDMEVSNDILAGDVNKLRIFERKIIRRIWGPVNENGHYRIRTNLEIECALENADIVRFIKSQRRSHDG